MEDDGTRYSMDDVMRIAMEAEVSFSVEWSKAATKQLLSIPKKQRLIILSRVQEHLDGCEDPRRAPNGKQLQGTDSGWRWRVGVYHIPARIEDGKKPSSRS